MKVVNGTEGAPVFRPGQSQVVNRSSINIGYPALCSVSSAAALSESEKTSDEPMSGVACELVRGSFMISNALRRVAWAEEVEGDVSTAHSDASGLAVGGGGMLRMDAFSIDADASDGAAQCLPGIPEARA